MFKPLVILSFISAISSSALNESSITDFLTKGNLADLIKAIEKDRAKTNQPVPDFIGIVQKYNGYEAAEYNVTTADGYILRLHRITASPKSPKAKGKPAVLLHHGVLLSSDHFVILRPDQSLGFLLADAGYDVWLGNCRGNSYSKSHIQYSTADPEFWDFSMDEPGVNDTSACIDFVLEKTGQKKLTYIGFSIATAYSYILLSSKPEYNDKINLLVSLAPVAYLSRTALLNAGRLILPTVLKLITNDPVPTYQSPRSDFVRKFFNYIPPSSAKIFFASAMDIKNLNSSDIPEILTRSPDTLSYLTGDHLIQVYENGPLRKYDYPCDALHPSCRNKIIYNQTEPPIYDLSLITAPNAIFYAPKDVFISIEVKTIAYSVLFVHHMNAERYRNAVPNVVAFEKVPDKNFNHLDFMLSTKANTLVYNKVLEVMSNYTY